MTTTTHLTPEQIEALGDELDELRGRTIADLGERDADLHPQRDQGPARPGDHRARAAVRRLPAAGLDRRHDRPGPLQDPGQHGDRPQRDARPVRLDEGPGAGLQALRVGHRLPGRPVAPLPQLHAPHPHQRARQGSRHRLRDPAHVRGPAVAPPRPRQPRLRDAAGAAVPVGRRRARPRGRADRGRRDHAGPTSATSCRRSGEGPPPGAQGLRGVPAAGRARRRRSCSPATSPPT